MVIVFGNTEKIFLSRVRLASILSAYNWMMLDVVVSSVSVADAVAVAIDGC